MRLLQGAIYTSLLELISIVVSVVSCVAYAFAETRQMRTRTPSMSGGGRLFVRVRVYFFVVSHCEKSGRAPLLVGYR